MSVEAHSEIDPTEEVQRAAAAAIGEPGDWLTAAERLDAWLQARDARTNDLDLARRQALSPFAGDGRHEATQKLDAAAVEVVHRVASDPGRLTRTWAAEQIDALGEEVYTELVGVTAIVVALDTYAAAMGRPELQLPDAAPGRPSRQRPDGVGDVGAWVSQTLDRTRANVSRTLSLVPKTDAVWRQLVDGLYSRGMEFFEVTWSRSLSRAQVELVAARTTADLECFY